MKITATLPDQVALDEIGRRAQRVRLDRNMTQAEVAAAAGVSVSTVERFEGGKQTQLANVLRILRALRMFDGFDRLLPESSIRPMEHLQGKTTGRQRASTTRIHRSANTGHFTWGDKK
jgi:transcriptional regulator with XRE-family HTH domain